MYRGACSCVTEELTSKGVMRPFFNQRVRICAAGADIDFTSYEDMPDLFFKETLKEACHSIGMPMLTDKAVHHLMSELRKQRIGAVNVRKNALGYMEYSRLGLLNAELMDPSWSQGELRSKDEPLRPKEVYQLGPWHIRLEALGERPEHKIASERVSAWDIVHGDVEYTLPSDEGIQVQNAPRIPPLIDVPQFLRGCVPWPVCALDEMIEGSGAIGADPKQRTRSWMWVPSSKRQSVRVRLSFERQHYRNKQAELSVPDGL